MGKRKSTDFFSPHDTNTICDITGFKVKLSETQEMWNGLIVIPEAHSERQPQDFPVIATKQTIYPKSRGEQVIVEDAVTAPEQF